MGHKEINLSSESVKPQGNFEEKVLEAEEPQKEIKKGKMKIVEKVKLQWTRFLTWWQASPKYVKILTILIPSLLILGGSLFFVYQVIYGPRNRPPRLLSIDTNYMMPKNLGSSKYSGFADLLLAKPSVPRTEESPINGRLFTKEEMEELKKRRPIAAMISNHIEARPTSNLSQADLVYEALVEGGITRFVAIFWSKEPNKIGPIRSARQYYLEWLSPFDPLFIYDGYALTGDPRTNAGGNISSYGIKSIYTTGAWRVQDRVAPHNEYSSTTKTWEVAQTRGWEGFPVIDSWQFKKDSGIDTRSERFKAKITFSNSDNYNVIWEYNKDSNTYFRTIGNVKDIDMETGQQISAKNVIVQAVKVTGPVDEYNRLIIDTIGTGNAAILQDGQVIHGTWEKTSRTSRTKYYDSNKNEIQFNRGLTWISAVRQIDGNFDIMEQ
jgi:hypothetical protein